LGFAAFLVLRRTHEALDLPDVVAVLAPVAEVKGVAPLRGERDDFAHGVIQQVDVGGEVHIRFNDKGVAAPTQGFAVPFFYQYMAGLNDKLVDLVEEFRREQADIVFERLKMVAVIIEYAVAEHFANADVLIHEFMQAIIVAIQIEPNHATDQYCPQGHAGAAVGLADLRCDLLLQQLEYRRA